MRSGAGDRTAAGSTDSRGGAVAGSALLRSAALRCAPLRSAALRSSRLAWREIIPLLTLNYATNE